MAIGTQKKLLAAALAALMMIGCGGAEERKAKYLERGKAYIAEKDWDKARVEIRNVLQIDPKTAEAHFLLGQVEEKRQEWSRAYSAYTKAVELDPELLEARERLAQFHLWQANASSGQDNATLNANALGLAQNQIEEILKREPKHAGARALQASMLFREGKTEEALTLAEEVVRGAPGHSAAVGLLATLYEQTGRTDDAERVLVEGAAHASEPLSLQLHLAQLYARDRKAEKAEQIMRDIIAAHPDELRHRISLAQFLSQADQLGKAEQVMREAVDADPADPRRKLLFADLLARTKSRAASIEYLQETIKANPELSELYFGLAQLHEQDQQRNEAKRVYQNVLNQFGDEPPGLQARNRLAAHAAAEGDMDRARQLTEAVLVVNPKDNDALLFRGRIAMQDGDSDAAVADFRSVLRDQPESVTVLHLLAEAHLRKGEMELADSSLRRAIEAAPGNVDARVKYARFLLARRDVPGALEHVDRALALAPENADARTAKAEILAAKGDLGAVKAELGKLKLADPENPESFLRMARVLLAEGDLEGAQSEIDEVLMRDPKHVSALLVKTDVLAAAKDMDALRKTIEQLKAAAPDNPEGFFRMGRLLRSQGDVAGALREYERGYGLARNVGKHLMLNEVVATQLSAGQHDQALARVQAVLREEPDHPTAHGLLGNVQTVRQDLASAEAAYARQVELMPGVATHYSRLAAVRGMRGDDAGAIAAFQQGLEAIGDDVRLLVGLASFQERQGDMDAAIDTYERTLKLQANNALAVNNLAVLLAEHRQDPESLARARELAAKLREVESPVFQDTIGWVHYRSGDYARAVEILEEVVESEPEVAVFHYHLGMAYAGAGDKQQARTHLAKALELGEFAEVEEARAALAAL
jgi:tetratricopeptide (TPR) repeat protein